MAYIIDASSLIESKNRLYDFEVCPGFWDWLSQQNTAGTIYSIQKVKEELLKGNDDLARWAKRQGSGFFLSHNDESTMRCMTLISDWVNRSDFKPQAKAEFLAGADPLLIAYAMAHKHIVVTDEVPEPGRKSKVKIPAVCQQFNVQWISLVKMLRQAGARFVLPPPPDAM